VPGNYAYYGGDGVTVCAEWSHDFVAFLRYMGECPEGLTLDRINPFGNYEPGNCQWATWEQQGRNHRIHHRPKSEEQPALLKTA
jgi:hypothetical protein